MHIPCKSRKVYAPTLRRSWTGRVQTLVLSSPNREI